MTRGRPRSTSLPYVPIDPCIETHPRTNFLIDALAELTNIPEQLLSVIPRRLIEWAGRQYVDGNIGVQSPRALARNLAPEFNLPPQKLFDALTDATFGFLILNDDGTLSIHDWDDYGGRVLADRKRWRERRNGAKNYHGDNSEISANYPRDNSEISPFNREIPSDYHRMKLKGEGDHDHDHTAREDAWVASGAAPDATAPAPSVMGVFPMPERKPRARKPRAAEPELALRYPGEGELLTLEALRSLMHDPPRSWRMVGGSAHERKLAEMCPLDGAKVAAALRATERNAGKPGVGYFVAVLAGEHGRMAKPHNGVERDIRVGSAEPMPPGSHTPIPGMRESVIT